MINDKQNLLPVKDYDSIINTYNKIIDKIELYLKTGDDCSNNFKLFLTVKMLKNVDDIVKQELPSELKEKFTDNIAYNLTNQKIGFEKIKELTETITAQIEAHESKVQEWSKQSKSYHENNSMNVIHPLNTIVFFYTKWCLIEVKNIDILMYYLNTIEKISDLRTLSYYTYIYDFIVKYQGWIMDLVVTPFIGSLYGLTLSQREIIKIKAEENNTENSYVKME